MDRDTLHLLTTYITARRDDAKSLLLGVNHTANMIVHCGSILEQSRSSWQPSIHTMDYLSLRIKDDSLYRLWIDCLSLWIDDNQDRKATFLDNVFNQTPAKPKLGITHHIEHLLASTITGQPDFRHLIALTDLFGIEEHRLLKGVYLTLALDYFRRKMVDQPFEGRAYLAHDWTIGWDDVDAAYTGSEDLSLYHHQSRFFPTLVARLEQSWAMAVSRAHAT